MVGWPEYGRAVAARGRIRHKGKSSMPELELCVYCKKPIYPEDYFVLVKPGAQASHQFGDPTIHEPHAHAKCHEQMVALETN